MTVVSESLCKVSETKHDISFLLLLDRKILDLIPLIFAYQRETTIYENIINFSH